MALELTDQNFDQEVKQFDGVVLVDFWAPWCTPCKMQGPIVEEVSKIFEANDKVKIAKLDVDENKDKAGEFQIMSIPTLKVFKGGQVVADMVSLQSKETLVSKINEQLK